MASDLSVTRYAHLANAPATTAAQQLAYERAFTDGQKLDFAFRYVLRHAERWEERGHEEALIARHLGRFDKQLGQLDKKIDALTNALAELASALAAQRTADERDYLENHGFIVQGNEILRKLRRDVRREVRRRHAPLRFGKYRARVLAPAPIVLISKSVAAD